MGINSEVREYIMQLIQKEINAKRKALRDRYTAKIDKAVARWRRTKGKKLYSYLERHDELQAQIEKLREETNIIFRAAKGELESLGYSGYVGSGSDFGKYCRTGINALEEKVAQSVLPQDEVKSINDMVADLNTKIMLAVNIGAIRKAIAAVNEYFGTKIEIE